MQVKIVKIYAWSAAIRVSRAYKTTRNTNGANPRKPSMTVNPANIFNILWPANIFAHSLTDKLIGFDK